MSVTYEWGGEFSNDEVNALHAEAFETRVFTVEEWNWVDQVARCSLGWVTARTESTLVGFANVIWDGLVHAWIQDVMVAATVRRRGVGVGLVRRCVRRPPRQDASTYTSTSRTSFDRSTSTCAGSLRPTPGSSCFGDARVMREGCHRSTSNAAALVCRRLGCQFYRHRSAR